MSKCGAHKKRPSSLRACHDFLPPWLTPVVSPVQSAAPLVCPSGRIQSSLLIEAGCLVRFPPCSCRSLTTNDYLSSGKLASALFPHSPLIQIKTGSISCKAVTKVRPQCLFTHWHVTEAPGESPMTLTSSCLHLRLHRSLSCLPHASALQSQLQLQCPGCGSVPSPCQLSCHSRYLKQLLLKGKANIIQLQLRASNYPTIL